MRNLINLIETAQVDEGTVWHGSWHRFEVFDIKKIDTGEGFQSYGWGLYFATEKKVADYYSKTLAHIIYDGRVLVSGETRDAIKALLYNLWNIDGAIEDEPHLTDAIRNIDKSLVQFSGGHLYEVEIPNDEFFLNYDLSFHEQSPFAQQALRNIHKFSDKSKVLKSYIDECINDNDTGKTIYAHISNFNRNEIKAWNEYEMTSKLLRSGGIMGMRYLDSLSRTGKSSTANYVMFDQSDIRIISRT